MEDKNLLKFNKTISLFHVISVMLITFSDNIPTVFFSNYAEVPGTVGYIVSCFEVQAVLLAVLKNLFSLVL